MSRSSDQGNNALYVHCIRTHSYYYYYYWANTLLTKLNNLINWRTTLSLGFNVWITTVVASIAIFIIVMDPLLSIYLLIEPDLSTTITISLGLLEAPSAYHGLKQIHVSYVKKHRSKLVCITSCVYHSVGLRWVVIGAVSRSVSRSVKQVYGQSINLTPINSYQQSWI